MLRKSPWNGHWSPGERKEAWSKLLMIFICNFPFICYLGRICNKCYEPQVLNTHPLSMEELLSVMLWCSVYLYYTALLSKVRTQVMHIVDGYKLLVRTKTFSLFRLLKNETLEMFVMRERRKRKHKFGRNKVCKGEEVRKCFVNPEIENEVFY